MVIEIKYTLATEGMYHVHQSFRAQADQLDTNGHFVYTGCATFEHEISEMCSKNAIDFLWKLLYTGILGAHDSHVLLEAFYNTIDELCKFIRRNSASSAAGCSRHINGIGCSQHVDGAGRDSVISVQIFNH